MSFKNPLMTELERLTHLFVHIAVVLLLQKLMQKRDAMRITRPVIQNAVASKYCSDPSEIRASYERRFIRLLRCSEPNVRLTYS